jgi:hypothetical protein
MMELRHIAMVNWHLFDVEDIEITGHTGVFGENRSGKSTILDMAQVVLTGGNRNVQRLNAVAGDKGRSRSASKRSVVDYCLGTLGEDQRKREQARTYICLGFADTEGKRPAVSIGMAIEARRCPPALLPPPTARMFQTAFLPHPRGRKSEKRDRGGRKRSRVATQFTSSLVAISEGLASLRSPFRSGRLSYPVRRHSEKIGCRSTQIDFGCSGESSRECRDRSHQD